MGTTLISLSVFLMLFVLLHLIQLAADGAFVFGWIFYIVFCAGVGIVRGEIRSFYDIGGHPIEDFLFSLFLYPSVAVQIDVQTRDIDNDVKSKSSKVNNGFSA